MFPLKFNMANCPPEYQLNVLEVPIQFREIGIWTGYRKPRLSLSKCVRSIFWPTNETLNFWTHFLPFWYFFGKFCELYKDERFVDDSYHWPFLAYLATACAWPMVSCFAHLFSVMSEEVRHICFFLDYLSISWYSFGAATVYHAYAFDELFFDTWFNRYYIYAAALAAVGCTFMACKSRFILSHKIRKFIRIVSFFLPFAVNSLPLAERLLRRYAMMKMYGNQFEEEYVNEQEALLYHGRQFIWAASGIFFYGFHIPEAFFPGKFDIIGHSHQILHICGIMATSNQLWACHADMINRRQFLHESNALVSGGVDLTLIILVLIANLLIGVAFTIKLFFFQSAVEEAKRNE